MPSGHKKCCVTCKPKTASTFCTISEFFDSALSRRWWQRRRLRGLRGLVVQMAGNQSIGRAERCSISLASAAVISSPDTSLYIRRSSSSRSGENWWPVRTMPYEMYLQRQLRCYLKRRANQMARDLLGPAPQKYVGTCIRSPAAGDERNWVGYQPILVAASRLSSRYNSARI